jgi:hypothetical protein
MIRWWLDGMRLLAPILPPSPAVTPMMLSSCAASMRWLRYPRHPQVSWPIWSDSLRRRPLRHLRRGKELVHRS